MWGRSSQGSSTVVGVRTRRLLRVAVAGVMAVVVSVIAPTAEMSPAETPGVPSLTLVTAGTGLGGLEADDNTGHMVLADNGAVVVHRTLTSTDERRLLWRSLATGQVEEVYPGPILGDEYADQFGVSDDGCKVVVTVYRALVAADTDQRSDVYVRDMCADGPWERVSLTPSGAPPDRASWGDSRISGNGRYVAFTSGASDIRPDQEMHPSGGMTNDLFVKDLVTGHVELVTRVPPGETDPVGFPSGHLGGSLRTSVNAFSDSGRTIVFTAAYPGCGPETALVYTVGSDGYPRPLLPGDCQHGVPHLSGDGSTVAIPRSEGTIVMKGTTNGQQEVLAPASGEELGIGDISREGRRILLHRAVSFGERRTVVDDWMVDHEIDPTVGPNGSTQDELGTMSMADERTVVFMSSADDLDPSDTSDDHDIYATVAVETTGGDPFAPPVGEVPGESGMEDPVSAASGNFYDSVETLPSDIDADLGLMRTYNSLDDRGGVFGPGWSTLLDAKASRLASSAQVRLADGRTVVFAGGGGGFVRPDRFDADLVVEGGLYRLRWDDGRVWRFRSDGRLDEVLRPDGTRLTITRGGDGRPSRLTSFAGSVEVGHVTLTDATTTYPWQDGQPLVTEVTASSGIEVDVAFVDGGYDQRARLTRVGQPRPEVVAPWSTDWVAYTLDLQGRVERIERTIDAGSTTGLSVRVRLQVANTYDLRGRVATQTSPDGSVTTFTYEDGVTRAVDGASGDETVYVSDDDGREVGIADALDGGSATDWSGGSVATTTDRNGATTRLLYDAQERLRVKLLPDPENGEAEAPGAGQTWANVATWAMRYESWDYATSSLPGDSRVTRYRNAVGEVTEYGYVGAAPSPHTVTTAAGTALAATTTITYEGGVAAGAVDTVTTAEGIVTDRGYGPDGRLTSVTQGGRTTGHVRVVRGGSGWQPGWATAEPTVAWAEQVIAPGSGASATRTTTTLHRADGEVVRTIDPLAAAVTPGHLPARRVHDDMGFLRSTFDEAGAETVSSTRYVTDRVVPRTLGAACGCGPDPAWTAPPDVGHIVQSIDPDGVTVTESYSRNGDLVEDRRTDGSATPEVTRHTYGRLGRLERTEVDAGTASAPLVEVTTHRYDANGNQTVVTAGPTVDAADRTTTTTYDMLGRVTETLGPQGDPQRQETAYTYDLLGRTLTRTDAASDGSARVMTAWHYDPAGRVDQEVVFLDGYANDAVPYPPLSSHTDARVSRHTYDGDGQRVTTVEGPPNATTFSWPSSETPAQLDALPAIDARRVTRHTYDATTGQLATTTRPDRTVLTTTYDAAGRTREVTETAAPPTSGSPATRLVARYDYDPRGRVLHRWAPYVAPGGTVGEVVVDQTWTPTGLLATQTDPHLAGAPSGTVATRTTTYTAAGRVSSVTDPLGHEVTYAHQLGRPVARHTWNAAGTAIVSQQSWAYTRNGRIASRSTPHAPGTGSPPATAFTYDDRGRVVLVVDPSGRRTSATYTNGGLPATVTWTTGTSDPTPSHAGFTYDGAGRRTSASGTYGAWHWAYDRTGNLTGETRPTAAGPATDQWRWDLAGNRSWRRHSTGRRERYEWDKQGRMTSVALDLAAEGSTPSWFPIGSYGRSGFGDTVRESLSVFASGGQRLWTVDVAGRPVTYSQSVTPNGQPATTTDTTLTWRPDGRLDTNATIGQPTWDYDYDLGGQLTEADPSSGATLSWAYGIAGRRTMTTTSSGTVTNTWDAGTGQLTAQTSAASHRTFTYDAAGRRQSDATTPTGGSTLTTSTTYDDRGALASAGAPALTVTRSYDLDGNLVALDDTPGDGNPAAALTWDPAHPTAPPSTLRTGATAWHTTVGESLLRTDSSGGTVYFAQDVFGSIVDTAVTTQPNAYDPWGNPDTAVSLGFGYRSSFTVFGLVHLRNREYDPTTGTFTTHDPLDGVDGTPTVGHPSHYADNDPLNKTDPLGLRPTDCVLGEAPCDVAARRTWDQMNEMAALLAGTSASTGVARCALPNIAQWTVCTVFGASGASDQVGATILRESGDRRLLDPKPMLKRYFEEHRPYGGKLVADVGHPDHAFFYDTLGNVAWGHVIRVYLDVLPDEFVLWCQESCPNAKDTSSSVGDNLMVEAGLSLGRSATFGDYVRALRSTVPALLARADGPLNYGNRRNNKLVAWGRV